MELLKCNKIIIVDNRVLILLANLKKKIKMTFGKKEKIGSEFFKCLGYLSLSILVLIVNCKKEETYSIPSFCAAESDWGPNNLIVFANEPWEIIPPETVFPNDPRPRGLWTVKSDGSELKFLVGTTPDGRDFGQCPEWSPDGNWIVANDNIGRIWMVSADGDSIKQITQAGKRWNPSFSPTGEKLLFDRYMGPDSGGIWMLDIQSGFEKRITPFGVDPNFSPSGDKFVCYGWEESYNKPVLKIVDTIGNTTQVVYTNTEGEIDAPSFSPDSFKIAFGKPYVYTNDITNIWVVNVDGSNPRKLTSKGGRWPSWSPDGSKIVYTKISLNDLTQEGNGDLYIINPDGSDEKRLTFFYSR